MEKLLPDICGIQYGYAFDSAKFSDSEGIPLIRIRDVVRGYSETYTTEECSAEYIVNDGDMLIGMDGEFNIAHWKGGKAYLNQRVCRLIPSGEVDALYLYYFMPKALKAIEDKTPFVTVKHLSAKELNKVVVPMPLLDEQKKIASSLQRVDELIALRKEQLVKLDQLVKSRFIELFGDPVQNPMGWKTEILKKTTAKIGSGATPKGGKESYQTEGITLIRSMNVHDGRFEYKDLAHITDEQAKQLENVTVEENDVFINITGASVARSCIVPKHVLPARVNQHVAIIRCITSMLNPVFANQMFLNASFKSQLLDIGESGGATRQAITKQQLESLAIILPPLELQEQFAAFVKQSDKSKLAIQQSLDKLELLKKSLMQEYFG